MSIGSYNNGLKIEADPCITIRDLAIKLDVSHPSSRSPQATWKIKKA